jgi:hypothetical protein
MKLDKICGSSVPDYFRQRAGRQLILDRKKVNIPEANLILVSLWMKFCVVAFPIHVNKQL